MSHSIIDVVQKIKEYLLSTLNGFSEVITYTESSNIATRSYSVGDKLIYNRILYRAKTSIAKNATLVPGTNIELDDDIITQISYRAPKPIIITKLLSSGNTQLTFDIPGEYIDIYTGNTLIDFYTDTGIGYESMAISNNPVQVTLTFLPQNVATVVYCCIQRL